MKKKILKVFMLSTFVLVALLINVQFNKIGNTDKLMLENVLALQQAQAEGGTGTYTCYSTYNNCWIFNCSTIYRCGNPCTDASADEYSDIGSCSN